ncbi:MAG TPA: GNAT family N-acetyltransferase [Chthoniobacterales bacterium]|nr:GNAT family N-acetyltransferase [Chthoniobacterales bacterium]
MPDLLVKLYALPKEVAAPAVTVRRAFSAERELICEWVGNNFSRAWAAECAGCFTAGRPTCFVAVADEKLVGFACYDTTARGMFGPIGVAEAARHGGLGRALLLTTLRDMAATGYAYAVIGGAGADSLAFYRNAVDVLEIAGSEPGFYRGMLRPNA